MDRSNKTIIFFTYMHNSKYQCHTAACSTYHRPNLLLLAAKQESYKKKAYLLKKNIEEFCGKSSEERTSRQKKIR